MKKRELNLKAAFVWLLVLLVFCFIQNNKIKFILKNNHTLHTISITLGRETVIPKRW